MRRFFLWKWKPGGQKNLEKRPATKKYEYRDISRTEKNEHQIFYRIEKKRISDILLNWKKGISGYFIELKKNEYRIFYRIEKNEHRFLMIKKTGKNSKCINTKTLKEKNTTKKPFITVSFLFVVFILDLRFKCQIQQIKIFPFLFFH